VTSGLRNAFQAKPQCFWAAVLHKGILCEASVIHKSNGNPLRRVDQDHYKHHNIIRGNGKTMIKTTRIIPTSKIESNTHPSLALRKRVMDSMTKVRQAGARTDPVMNELPCALLEMMYETSHFCAGSTLWIVGLRHAALPYGKPTCDPIESRR
jgi:hypothetical protein